MVMHNWMWLANHHANCLYQTIQREQFQRQAPKTVHNTRIGLELNVGKDSS